MIEIVWIFLFYESLITCFTIRAYLNYGKNAAPTSLFIILGGFVEEGLGGGVQDN